MASPPLASSSSSSSSSVSSLLVSFTCAAVPFAIGLTSGWIIKAALEQKNAKKQTDDGIERTALKTATASVSNSHAAPRRFGAAIRLVPEQFDRYTELHDAVWDAVLDRMYQSNIRNFTIYFHKETNTMFQHFEWIGHWKQSSSLSKEEESALFEADMKAIAEDPITREWWIECEPCQEPFAQFPKGAKPPSAGGSDDWWAPLVCLNHCGYWPVQYSTASRDPDFVPQNPRRSTTTQPVKDD